MCEYVELAGLFFSPPVQPNYQCFSDSLFNMTTGIHFEPVFFVTTIKNWQRVSQWCLEVPGWHDEAGFMQVLQNSRRRHASSCLSAFQVGNGSMLTRKENNRSWGEIYFVEYNVCIMFDHPEYYFDTGIKTGAPNERSDGLRFQEFRVIGLTPVVYLCWKNANGGIWVFAIKKQNIFDDITMGVDFSQTGGVR